MTIPFAGVLDEATLRNSMRYRAHILQLVAFVLMGVSLLSVIAVYTGAAFVNPRHTHAFAFLGLVGFGLWFVAPGLRARQLFESSKMLRVPLRGTADKQGVTLSNEFGASTLPWSIFDHVEARSGAILLYISSSQYYILPRAFFQHEADWVAFRQLAIGSVSGQRVSFYRVLLLWAGVIIAIILVYGLLNAA